MSTRGELASVDDRPVVKLAEECERLADRCLSEVNRQILVNAAARWRMLAEESAADGRTSEARAPS
jgi:hypothetical protein